MTLPLGAREARRVGGGDINEAWHVWLDGEEAFVKTRADAGQDEYALEAAGLGWLGEPGALRVPRVIEVGEDYLALQWVAPGGLSPEGAEELGRGLAAIHAAGAPRFGDPGIGERFGAQAGFGSLRLPNEPTDDWVSFYAERRLLALARIAGERGALSDAGVAAVERVCERLGEIVGPPEPPARLHGDLWAGNVHADTEGRPWLIDPSAYGGHREVDLAMLRPVRPACAAGRARVRRLRRGESAGRRLARAREPISAAAAARACGAVRRLLPRGGGTGG